MMLPCTQQSRHQVQCVHRPASSCHPPAGRKVLLMHSVHRSGCFWCHYKNAASLAAACTIACADPHLQLLQHVWQCCCKVYSSTRHMCSFGSSSSFCLRTCSHNSMTHAGV